MWKSGEARLVNYQSFAKWIRKQPAREPWCEMRFLTSWIQSPIGLWGTLVRILSFSRSKHQWRAHSSVASLGVYYEGESSNQKVGSYSKSFLFTSYWAEKTKTKNPCLFEWCIWCRVYIGHSHNIFVVGSVENCVLFQILMSSLIKEHLWN